MFIDVIVCKDSPTVCWCVEMWLQCELWQPVSILCVSVNVLLFEMYLLLFAKSHSLCVNVLMSVITLWNMTGCMRLREYVVFVAVKKTHSLCWYAWMWCNVNYDSLWVFCVLVWMCCCLKCVDVCYCFQRQTHCMFLFVHSEWQHCSDEGSIFRPRVSSGDAVESRSTSE